MTIKDIAKESGYAVGTVSRVLNNHPDVSEKARETILAVVEKHHFRLINNAKHLKQQGSKGIAIIVKGSQNMLFASIVTAALMKDVFTINHIAPENLSRTLEDAGTFGAVLIPWNSNAIYASQMLGVAPLAFIPYCFLNYLTPIIDLIYAKTGFTIKKTA